MTLHCPYCDSTDIVRYKTVLWKCNECGRVFSTPIDDALVAQSDPVVEEASVTPDTPSTDSTA